MVIYRDETGPLPVQQAIELLRAALPKEPAGDVYARITEDGEIDWDGPVEVRLNEKSPIRSQWLEQDFDEACRQLAIKPRNLYRPNFTDFAWDATAATYYTITHDEFVRYAGHYGVAVQANSPSGLQAPAQEGQSDAGWTLREPERHQGYSLPLYRALLAAYRAGRTRPKARDILEAFRSDRPSEIAQVNHDGFTYYDSTGNAKPADLKAIGEAIRRMTS